MPSKITTVDQYIESLAEPARSLIVEIRSILHQAVPAAKERIGYGMPVVQLPTGYIFYYGAWKKHIGLYPIYPGTDAFEAAIESYRDRTHTVRLPFDRETIQTVVPLVIAERLRALSPS
jgi:uncharacterized protein YdhG (YjbR/CyaY superfamily)